MIPVIKKVFLEMKITWKIVKTVRKSNGGLDSPQREFVLVTRLRIVPSELIT